MQILEVKDDMVILTLSKYLELVEGRERAEQELKKIRDDTDVVHMSTTQPEGRLKQIQFTLNTHPRLLQILEHGGFIIKK